MPRFDNQCFVVTGGTRGIGLATARRIAGEGGRVLVTGLNHENLAAAAQIDGINVLRNEVSDPAAADVLAEEAHRLYGALDGVFLNAGIAIFARLGEITLEKFRKQFDVNVAGVLFGAQALAPLVRSDGTLLLMSSGAKTNGGPGARVY